MNPKTDRGTLTIIVSGMVAGVPYQGGATWAILQYLLGLRQLGHRVYFVEPLGTSAVQPAGCSLESSTNAEYFRSVVSCFGLDGNAALLLSGTQQTVGLSYRDLARVAGEADVLINIAGMLRDDEIKARVPIRLYLDLDPVFTQLWHAADGIDMGFADHTHYATVGLTVGRPDSVVPDCGKTWLTTVPPIVLDYWPVANEEQGDAFTTIANWRGYGSVEHNGTFYGQKVHSWRSFMALPRMTTQQFTVALAIHPDETRDLGLLRQNNWSIVDPRCVAGSPSAYQRFVRGSKAEIGIAKSGYVAARSGWFSDRSVCYLASGRPVVAQETGFSDVLPTGDGLLAFNTLDDAAAAIETVNRDYAQHCQSARRIAEEYFDSRTVLSSLLQQIGATS